MDSQETYYTYQSPVFFGYNPDGGRICGAYCILAFTLSSVIISIILMICLYSVYNKRKRNRLRVDTETQQHILDQYSRQSEQNTTVVNLGVPLFSKDRRGRTSSELARRAAAFTHSYPPSDALPTAEQVDQIISQKGYGAWRFVLDRSMVNETGMPNISNEGRVVEFGINNNKWRLKPSASIVNKDICVQSNFPFFWPVQSVDEEKRREAISCRAEFMHYFEITLISRCKGVENMAIGLTTKPYPYFRFPGWCLYSIGYHSCDGKIFHENNFEGKPYGPSWGDDIGETVGVGYRPNTGEIFFTKNGEYLGVALRDSKHVWYPAVAADGPCRFEVNFGDKGRGFRFEKARNYGPGSPLKEECNDSE
ncbi:1506_t:CDS:2 [Acaulospora morrowiae]|uniref:1506_t:CDS:1 n=1 Tax=Acaulospora morrowiae TaxID=94023 RepID=A0A9N9CY97_9GLOM|nr:1506_t:CDS:2 [Acaulospora morrowiae]